MISTISPVTLGNNTVTVIQVPHSPGLRSVEPWFQDQVAVVRYPWTGKTQTQGVPGAEQWGWMCTLPPLNPADADEWISFLMDCRGMQNGFLMGDPMKTKPRGNLASPNAPVVNGTNLTASATLNVRTLVSNQFRLLLPGDYLEVNYRLYRNLDIVNSDGNGGATLRIWPSLREPLTDGMPINFRNPQGMFRLATNKRSWSADFTRLTSISFPITEFL